MLNHILLLIKLSALDVRRSNLKLGILSHPSKILQTFTNILYLSLSQERPDNRCLFSASGIKTVSHKIKGYRMILFSKSPSFVLN